MFGEVHHPCRDDVPVGIGLQIGYFVCKTGRNVLNQRLLTSARLHWLLFLSSNSSLAACTNFSSFKRSYMTPAKTFDAYSIPFRPTGDPEEAVACHEWAGTPNGQVAVRKTFIGRCQDTLPLSV